MDTAVHGISDKELLTDLLKEEDYLIKRYTESVTQTSDKGLRKILISNLNECAELQFGWLDQLRKKEIYKLQAAESQTIRQSMQKIAQLKQEVWDEPRHRI
jgi:spore coat protein CotF